MDFNDKQTEVIEYGTGTLLVEAGPGSGKTTVIVSRIKNLIDQDVSPESFLVITFTRKAAENLKNRLKKCLDKEIVSKMQISTIHSFCLEYLKNKGIDFKLLDDDASERKSLFIQQHKEELGFTGPATVLGYQYPSIVDKYGEYTCFNVDSEGLYEEIKNTRPVSQKYINSVDSMNHFSKRQVQFDEFTDDWYNARFLQVVKSFPKYLELLEENNYVDYDTLQLKTLKELEDCDKTEYTTIFVDEFQDTDPLQYEIFKILEKNSEYFTAVGDVDQHIYGFRSSFIDYFNKMENDGLVDKRISLNCNYRSTKDIVDVTDNFIKDQRKESLKELESSNREYDNPTFLVENGKDDEPQKIFDIILYLKESGKIKNYGEVGVLYRTHNNKTVTELINLFNQFNEGKDSEDQIKFTIKGQSDLAEQDEVKSLITMLWYLTRNLYRGYIPSPDELDKLNLKAFCGEYFETKFWSLSSKTKEYLCNIQDDYYDEIVKVRNEVRREENNEAKEVSSYKISGDKNLPHLKKIFNQVQMPVVDLSKIEDENDREFFEYLDDLRREIESEDPPMVFDVFYDLLTYGNYFDDMENKTPQLKNLALLSQTVFNYTEFISKTDLKGLYYFLSGVVRNYTSNYSENEGVQLMTVHSAKGLEFPVTIVLSLQKNNFPMISKDPNREKNTAAFGKDNFYTPLKYLKYKKFLLDEFPDLNWMQIEDMLDAQEENRVIYVAMTRAADLLILSSIGELPDQIEKVKGKLVEYNGVDDLDSVEIHKHFTNQEKEPIILNFSKFNLYNSCNCAYNFAYNIGFAFPRKEVTDLGSVFHNVLDKVNQKLKVNHDVSDEELDNLIKECYSFFFDMDDDPEQFEEIKNDIIEYTKKQACNFDVIDSEYAFSVDMGDYTLNGAVDLIYKISDNEIGILDYKNAKSNPMKVESYSRQLFTYALALKELDEFKDYTIKEGRIHFVLNNDEPVFEITDDLIKKQEKKLHDVALELKNPNNKYSPITELKPDGENLFCNTCEYRIFCRK